MRFVFEALCAVYVAALSGCSALPENAPSDRVADVEICLRTSAALSHSRAADPDEELISDVNLFIFNDRGVLEERAYLERRDIDVAGGSVSVHRKLLLEVPYDIYACANIGYALDLTTREELEAYRYHLIYPDEYSRGIPMCAQHLRAEAFEGEPIVLELERTMAKISLRIDRTALNPGVRLIVKRVTIGGCPRSVTLFGRIYQDISRMR